MDVLLSSNLGLGVGKQGWGKKVQEDGKGKREGGTHKKVNGLHSSAGPHLPLSDSQCVGPVIGIDLGTTNLCVYHGGQDVPCD